MIDLSFLPLKELAKEHYNGLNVKVYDRFKQVVSYFEGARALALRSPYLEAAFDVLLTGFSEKVAKALKFNNVSYADMAMHTDIQYILDVLDKLFKITLSGDLKSVKRLITLVYPRFKLYIDLGNKKKLAYLKSFQPFIAGLKYVWDYDKFIGKSGAEDRWDGYQLARKLGVSCCPYCNRMYTITVFQPPIPTVLRKDDPIDTRKVIRPEFDHFYSKARYPFLALSFFNLVPSCTVCNSTLKVEQEMDIDEHCHPYVEGYEDVFEFTTGVSVRDFLSKGVTDVPVSFTLKKGVEKGLGERATATQKLFRIADIYPGHADIAAEMLMKSTGHSKSMIKAYWQGKSEHGHYLYPTKDDLYRHFVGNFMVKKDFHKRPMAKFHADLLKETELLKFIQDLPARPGK
ncbi:hypothetical protein [Pedobacter sp. AJM]|uniref:hypothetical protein n=1 Tax=Pedobacter sp. AJM TaxID=2003629 RepID=UPI000B4C1651|nr:hypothetical protein [Pedobacter sp. AJM]OWK70319.1 hypothetical protein CBW18_12725 [Pedobacter sp. AJM]